METNALCEAKSAVLILGVIRGERLARDPREEIERAGEGALSDRAGEDVLNDRAGDGGVAAMGGGSTGVDVSSVVIFVTVILDMGAEDATECVEETTDVSSLEGGTGTGELDLREDSETDDVGKAGEGTPSVGIVRYAPSFPSPVPLQTAHLRS